MRVAVLGTGIMGAGMTRNLVGAGHDVRVWNRTRERAEGLGAEVADSPEDGVRGAEVVVTMLPDVTTVAAVVDRAAGGMEHGASWAQTSTVGVDGARALGEWASELGLRYVDSPVLGTRGPAEAGELVVLASGDAEPGAPARGLRGDRVQGRRPRRRARRGLALQARDELLGARAHRGRGRDLAFARSVGIEGERVLETVAGGPLDAGYLQAKGRAMLAGELDPQFPLSLALKDARLVLAAADDAGLELPALRGAARAYARAAEAGHGGADVAATYAGLVGGRQMTDSTTPGG